MTFPDIDWEGNCNFDENGKVVSFKVAKASNHYRMRPLPQGEKTINEAKQASIWLDSVVRPVTRDAFILIFKRLTIHCGMQNRTPQEIASLTADYYQDLGKYPAKLIDEACSAYRLLPENNSFMPSSGKLISFMQVEFAKMQYQRKIINQILGLTG